jgi:hypothetical protein
MDRIDNQLKRSLVSQWEELKACIARLNNSTDIVPKDGWDVFKHVGSTAAVSNFQLDPVLFVLPERASATTTDLHIVVEGRISLDRAEFEATGKLRTSNFATQAGYFRLKSNNMVVHVYGAHYDFAENELGHPAFHVQMKSFANYAGIIQAQYDLERIDVVDGMATVLKTVRLPSAQMDAFSLFLQLIADHLLWSQSSEADWTYFTEFVKRSKEIQGAASRIPRLQVAPAIHCYRAAHWYSPSS